MDDDAVDGSDPDASPSSPGSYVLRVQCGATRTDDNVVEIRVELDTTWEDAKAMACAARGVDPSAHRLLFRGKERRDWETMFEAGVRHGKHMKGMMLLETEASLRARHEADQKRQMEEARLARKETYAAERREANANGPGSPRGKRGAKRGGSSPPPDPTTAAFRAIDAVMDDVDALEREVNDAARGASERGVFEKTHHAGLSNRLEKALIALDGVDAMGDDQIRAMRKSIVRRVNSLCEAVDDAYGRYGRP
jgi:hypothetical protein